MMTALLLSAAFTSTAPQGFALVVTNNRSLELSRPDLHYADDDGVKYAQLFREFYGEDHVHLLTEFDASSTVLYPQEQALALPPTRENVQRLVEQLARDIEDAKQKGAQTHVHVVFAAHGDIANGEGFVELADGRLTARNLEQDIVAKLPADRVHLVIDSCNSYFMLNPRKPGMTRWEVKPEKRMTLLEKYPNVGAVISTSAEAITYEWSEIQSGIFSHEIRSALRGAADANADGSVSYAEVQGFVTVANQTLANDLYRPKIYARGPNNDARETMLAFGQRSPRRLILDPEKQQRITIRDERGVRLVDLHKGARFPVTLHLPADSGPLLAYEAVQTGTRPSIEVTQLPQAEELVFAELPSATPQVASRGEAPVFKDLFETPFGQEILERVLREVMAKKESQSFGISKQESDRLAYHLRSSAALERDDRRMSGALMLTVGGMFAAFGTAAYLDARDCTYCTAGAEKSSLVMAGLGGAALVAGLASLLIPSDSEELYAKLLESNLQIEEERARTVREIELEWKERVDEIGSTRRLAGWAMTVLGALYATGAATMAYSLSRDGYADDTDRLIAAGLGIFGAGVAGMGLYIVYGAREPVERTWDLYIDQRDRYPLASDDSVRDLRISAGPASKEGGFALGIGGSF